MFVEWIHSGVTANESLSEKLKFNELINSKIKRLLYIGLYYKTKVRQKSNNKTGHMKTYRNNELKKRIQSLCKEKGVTQTELASRIGITRATFSDNIGGDMRLSTLEKIANALKIQIRDLF